MDLRGRRRSTNVEDKRNDKPIIGMSPVVKGREPKQPTRGYPRGGGPADPVIAGSQSESVRQEGRQLNKAAGGTGMGATATDQTAAENKAKKRGTREDTQYNARGQYAAQHPLKEMGKIAAETVGINIGRPALQYPQPRYVQPSGIPGVGDPQGPLPPEITQSVNGPPSNTMALDTRTAQERAKDGAAVIANPRAWGG